MSPSSFTASTLKVQPLTSDSGIPLTSPEETGECRQLLLCKCSSKWKARLMALGADKVWSSCTWYLYLVNHGTSVAGTHPSCAARAFATILLEGGRLRMQGCRSHLHWCGRVKGNDSVEPALLPSFQESPQCRM